MSLPRVLENFGECFTVCFEIGLHRLGILSKDAEFDKNTLLNSPFDALLFFTQYAHERVGGSLYPICHRIALRKYVNRKNFVDTLFSDDTLPDKIWNEFERLTRKLIGGPNEKCTKGPVRNVLVKLRETGEPNIISLLSKHSIEGASRILREEIKGIGPKISALFLRDLQECYNFWNPNESNYYLLQPVDRWVGRMAEECWPAFIWSKKDHDRDAKEITRLCIQSGVNPIRFNMGAWFVGSHYYELCRFHNIPEDLIENRSDCIEKFDKDKVKEALKRYEIEFMEGEVLRF